MRRHLAVLAAALLAMSAMVAAGGGIPPVPKEPARARLRDIPSDVPGQFSTSWSWVKGMYRPQSAAPDSAAKAKR